MATSGTQMGWQMGWQLLARIGMAACIHDHYHISIHTHVQCTTGSGCISLGTQFGSWHRSKYHSSPGNISHEPLRTGLNLWGRWVCTVCPSWRFAMKVLACHAMAWQREGWQWHGISRQWHGMAWHGMASWQGHGLAWRDDMAVNCLLSR